MAEQEWSQQAVEQQAAEIEKQHPETPEPEAKVEEPVKEKVEERVEKVVPLGALHEERARRREIALQNQRLQTELQELKRQQQEILQRVSQQQQPQVPSYEQDPLANMNHGVQQTQKELQELKAHQQRQEQYAQQQMQMQHFLGQIQSAQNDFASKEPNAVEGIDFWKTSVLKEYEASGMTKAQAMQRIQQEVFLMSRDAFTAGENPAEIAYNRALARGYVPPSKKLDMQKAGQQAALPQGSGGKSGGLPTLEALAKMDTMKDFAKATAGENWEKLMRKYQ